MQTIKQSREINKTLWSEIWNQIEIFRETVDTDRVVPRLDVDRIKDAIRSIDLYGGTNANAVTELIP